MDGSLVLWFIFVFVTGVHVGQILAATALPRSTFAMAPGETKTITTANGMEVTVSARER